MAATYDASLPTAKDRVRFLIQDTNVASAMLQDEEITFMLTEYPNYRLAAAACAEALSLKFAGMPQEKKIGNLSLFYGDQAKKYSELASKLRTQASKILLPYAGGISKADKNAINNDSDRVKPAFKHDMQDQKLPSIMPIDNRT